MDVRRTRPADVGLRARQVLLIALMALGSMTLWIATPLFWIWLASKLSDSKQASLGPYLIVIVGIPLTMVLIGRALYKLNDVYGRVVGHDASARVQAPWLKSLRGEREVFGRRRTILDVVMIASVSAALFVFGVWFFFFAGSSLPT